MRVSSTDDADRRRVVLLVAESVHQLDAQHELLAVLREQAGVGVSTAFVARLPRPLDRRRAHDRTAQGLAGWHTRSRWRRWVAATTSPVTPSRRRLRWATALDP